MRILLTGSTGQIGWELRHALAGVGSIITPNREELDLADPSSIEKFMVKLRPDLVINASGYTAVDKAESESTRAHQINATAPGLLADLARQRGAAIIHYSTDYVFDGSKPEPYTTEDCPAPINAYGHSKLRGEQNVLDANNESLVLRLSWMYGLRRRNFLLAILEQASQRDQLRVVDDQVGSPTTCTLVAAWTAQIIERSFNITNGRSTFSGKAGIYHLACSGKTSWCGFARRIIELADLPKPVDVVGIPTSEYPTPAKRPKQSVLNCETAVTAFGLEFTDWDTALQQIMVDYRKANEPSPAGSTTS